MTFVDTILVSSTCLLTLSVTLTLVISISNFVLQLEMANGPDGMWHNTCPYSTKRQEHISIGHAARYSTHVSWVGFRILGTHALKARHD